MGQTRSLVLASGSPRRRAFLEGLGLSFEVLPAELDETLRAGESPRGYVERLAREKASAVARQRPEAVVLAADTTVVLGAEVLAKPEDAEDARRMLRGLSGREHAVLTAVAVGGTVAGTGVEVLETVVETKVRFRALEDAEIAWYVEGGEPMDKAGAYAIQGRAGAFVEAIVGSYSNVVGLPLVETLALLRRAGVAMPWSEQGRSGR